MSSWKLWQPKPVSAPSTHRPFYHGINFCFAEDPVELRSQLLNILLAGRDTTASHLGWLFHCLSRDPTRYQKLRDTIIEQFGTYDSPTSITFSKIKGCQYLQHCNNEALRLYPVVPLNGRFANKDTVLPRGGGKDGKSPVFIPKNTAVDYSVHVSPNFLEYYSLILRRFHGRYPGPTALGAFFS
jgi:hypothetical protein